MNILEGLLKLAGAWQGSNKLWLPPAEAPYESRATAQVAPAARGKFVTITYTWAFDGEPQEGMLLWGYEAADDAITAAWIDSWHMGDKLMLSRGRAEASGALAVHGSYAVPDGPDWGWRTVLEAENDAFRVLMYNVMPDGGEMLGVEMAFGPG